MTISAATARAAATVYRFYDADGTLLYVGMSAALPSRLAEHSSVQPWWAHVATIKLEHYSDRDSAREAERQAIETEMPVHNVAGRPGSTWGSGNSGLRIHGFSDGLLAEAKAEAALDGDSLRDFLVRAVRSEIARRRAVRETER